MSSLNSLLKDGALAAGLSFCSRVATQYLFAAALLKLGEDELVQDFVNWFTDTNGTWASATADAAPADPVAPSQLSEDEIWDNEMLQNFTDVHPAVSGGGGGQRQQQQWSGDVSASDLADLLNRLRIWIVDLSFVVLLNTLFCYYEVLMERMFPARPTKVEVVYQQQANSAEAEQDGREEQILREEQIVREWIAKGRVRHASLSWWNTFVKWLLGMTVGGFLHEAIIEVAGGFLEGKEISLTGAVVDWLGSFIGILPITYLISLVAVPAPKRLVFRAGVELAFNLFVAACVYFIIAWLVTTDFARAAMRQSMAGEWNQEAADVPQPRLIDEL